MASPETYELPSERRSRLERQTPDTQSEPGHGPRPTPRPSSATCSPRPTATPTANTQGQMHTRIRELRYLVERLEVETLPLAIDDIVGPAVWSSAALMLREVANRSELLRRQCLSLAAVALESDHQTLF
jgi:hypothetical protein